MSRYVGNPKNPTASPQPLEPQHRLLDSGWIDDHEGLSVGFTRQKNEGFDADDLTRWWQLTYFWNFPWLFGELIRKFDEHMFQMGWIHQLDNAPFQFRWLQVYICPFDFSGDISDGTTSIGGKTHNFFVHVTSKWGKIWSHFPSEKWWSKSRTWLVGVDVTSLSGGFLKQKPSSSPSILQLSSFQYSLKRAT